MMKDNDNDSIIYVDNSSTCSNISVSADGDITYNAPAKGISCSLSISFNN